MEVRLDGRCAVITGGSKGLGLAMAERFAASGADVAILARNPETLSAAKAKIEAGAKGKVAAISADVSKAAEVRKAYDQIMSRIRQDRHLRQQCRPVDARPVGDDHRRDVAVRSRSQTLRADPLLPVDLPADEGAQMGPHHQRAQYRREGAGRRQRADLGQPRRADGLHQGIVAGGRAAQRAGQFAACRGHRLRPDRAPLSSASGPMSASNSSSRRPAERCRWGGWAAPRNSPMSRASSPRTPPPMSPAARSTSTAAARPWCDD